MAELDLKHEQAASSSQEETRSFLEERLAGIGEQIDAVRHSTDAMTKRAEASAADIAKRETRQVEERVAGLIGEARSLMVKSAPSGETLTTIRGEIESLNQRFDDIKAESASDHDVQSLKLAIEQLTSNVTTGEGGQPVADLEQRLSDLTTRLDENPVSDHMAPQFADLEQRIVGLDQKLAAAVGQQGDSAAFAALESQIAVVAERMSATEEKLGTLTTIEQSIAQLYTAVEDGKATDGILQRGLPLQSEAGPSPELVALEEGLAAVRQSSQASEQHNQETLEAVHETLEQIITKLANMEAREANAPAAVQPAVSAQPEQPAAQPESPADNDWQSAMQSHLQEADTPCQPASQPDHNVTSDVSPAFDPGPLPDLTAPETPEPELQEPVEVSVQSETAPETDAAPLDYIAQARLASQSASAQPSSPIAKGAGFFTDKILSAQKDTDTDFSAEENGQPKKSKSLFSLPFLTKKNLKSDNDQPETGQPEAGPAMGAEPKSSRRRLIMAGLMLLIAAGAFVYSKAGGNSPAGPAPTASVQEKVIVPPARSANTPVPEKSSQRVDQASQAKKFVEQISLTIPRNGYVNPFASTATTNQTGMPPAQALASSNRAIDPVMPAPVDLVTTASLSPASAADRNIQSPLNIQTAMRPAPKNTDTVPQTDQNPLPKAIGTLELRQAAASGDASAQFVIATRFADGKLLARDYAKAAAWYQKAAANGLAPAQYRLGTLFERGNGLPKDLNAARLWYERAAEKGNVKAMHNLAVIYASAAGGKSAADGKTDYAKARMWFEKASNHGLKDSQFNLAVIYERGLAGARDQQEAFYRYSQAASQGDRDAGLKARTLKNYLSAAELQSTQKRLASWRPQPAEKLANFVAIKDAKWQVGAKTPAKPVLTAKPTLSGKVLVKQTQTLLTRLGFDVGGVDGVMGSRTANAVRLFQLQNGLQVNGMVTNDLLQQLQARS